LSSQIDFNELRGYLENAKRDMDGALESAVTVPFDIFSEISSPTNAGAATVTVPLEDSLAFAVGDEVTFYDNVNQAFSSETTTIAAITATYIILVGVWTVPPVAQDELCKVTRYTDHIVLGPPPQIMRRGIQMAVYYGKLGILSGPIPIHDNAVIEYDDAIQWMKRVKENKEGIDDVTVPHYAYSTHRDYHPVSHVGPEETWHEDEDLIDAIEDDWDDG